MNPFEPIDTRGRAAAPSRTPLLLAAIFAFVTSAYWALLTTCIGVAAATGNVSGAQLIFPILLIGLYAHRGYRVWNGDATAARSLLWLHGLGGVMALVQMSRGDWSIVLMYGVKVLIHVGGGITAWLASRHISAVIGPM